MDSKIRLYKSRRNKELWIVCFLVKSIFLILPIFSTPNIYAQEFKQILATNETYLLTFIDPNIVSAKDWNLIKEIHVAATEFMIREYYESGLFEPGVDDKLANNLRESVINNYKNIYAVYVTRRDTNFTSGFSVPVDVESDFTPASFVGMVRSSHSYGTQLPLEKRLIDNRVIDHSFFSGEKLELKNFVIKKRERARELNVSSLIYSQILKLTKSIGPDSPVMLETEYGKYKKRADDYVFQKSGHLRLYASLGFEKEPRMIFADPDRSSQRGLKYPTESAVLTTTRRQLDAGLKRAIESTDDPMRLLNPLYWQDVHRIETSRQIQLKTYFSPLLEIEKCNELLAYQ